MKLINKKIWNLGNYKISNQYERIYSIFGTVIYLPCDKECDKFILLYGNKLYLLKNNFIKLSDQLIEIPKDLIFNTDIDIYGYDNKKKEKFLLDTPELKRECVKNACKRAYTLNASFKNHILTIDLKDYIYKKGLYVFILKKWLKLQIFYYKLKNYFKLCV